MRYLFWLVILVSFAMTGCAGQDYKEYAQAVKEQNITQQIRIEAQQREEADRRIQHQERMMMYATSAMAAASATKSTNDDLLVPMMIMVMEDKWATAEILTSANKKTPQVIAMKAPETTGELIQKSTGLVLGAVSLGTSAYTTGKAVDAVVASAATAGTQYYVSGENNTVTHDSNKSGSQNSVVSSGDSTITGDTINDQTGSGAAEDGDNELGMCTGDRPSLPITNTDASGVEWVSATCSCNSYQAGHCDA